MGFRQCEFSDAEARHEPTIGRLVQTSGARFISSGVAPKAVLVAEGIVLEVAFFWLEKERRNGTEYEKRICMQIKIKNRVVEARVKYAQHHNKRFDI